MDKCYTPGIERLTNGIKDETTRNSQIKDVDDAKAANENGLTDPLVEKYVAGDQAAIDKIATCMAQFCAEIATRPIDPA